MDSFKYLFRGTTEYMNFNIFGFTHIAILLVAIFGGVFIIKKMSASRKFELIVGTVLLTQQVVLYFWYLVSKYNLLTEGLPLYHCRISIMLTGIGLLFNKSICKKIGSIWGLAGSISALAYPVGMDPFVFPHITHFSFFIGHLFLLWGTIYCIFIEGIKLNKKEFKITMYFTNIYHILMFILNHAIEANYGYMRISPLPIGHNLHPVIYGLIVTILFNILVLTMNVFMNKVNGSKKVELTHK